MPHARRVPAGSLDGSAPSFRAKLDAAGIPRSVFILRANLLLEAAGVKMTTDDRLKILGVVGRLFDGLIDPPDATWQQEERERHDAERHCVYFIRHAAHVKIGVTSQGADVRFAGMQLPPGAELVAVIHGARRVDEQELHRRFAGSRVAGEWFDSTPELEALIRTFAV